MFKGSTDKTAFFEVEDLRGRVPAKVRSKDIEQYSELLKSGDPVMLTGKVSFPKTEDPDEEKTPTLFVDSVQRVSEAVRDATRCVVIRLDAERTSRQDLLDLQGLLQQSSGKCRVDLLLRLPEGAQAVIALDSFRVSPDESFLGSLERRFGVSVAELR